MEFSSDYAVTKLPTLGRIHRQFRPKPAPGSWYVTSAVYFLNCKEGTTGKAHGISLKHNLGFEQGLFFVKKRNGELEMSNPLLLERGCDFFVLNQHRGSKRDYTVWKVPSVGCPERAGSGKLPDSYNGKTGETVVSIDERPFALLWNTTRPHFVDLESGVSAWRDSLEGIMHKPSLVEIGGTSFAICTIGYGGQRLISLNLRTYQVDDIEIEAESIYNHHPLTLNGVAHLLIANRVADFVLNLSLLNLHTRQVAWMSKEVVHQWDLSAGESPCIFTAAGEFVSIWNPKDGSTTRREALPFNTIKDCSLTANTSPEGKPYCVVLSHKTGQVCLFAPADANPAPTLSDYDGDDDSSGGGLDEDSGSDSVGHSHKPGAGGGLLSRLDKKKKTKYTLL